MYMQKIDGLYPILFICKISKSFDRVTTQEQEKIPNPKIKIFKGCVNPLKVSWIKNYYYYSKSFEFFLENTTRIKLENLF